MESSKAMVLIVLYVLGLAETAAKDGRSLYFAPSEDSGAEQQAVALTDS